MKITVPVEGAEDDDTAIMMSRADVFITAYNLVTQRSWNTAPDVNDVLAVADFLMGVTHG